MNTAGFATVNPSTGEEIETFSYFTPGQTEKVVASADQSFQSFRKLSVYQRARLFADLGNTLRKNKAHLAQVISTEMGKIFSEAEAEIEKCTHEADWYAEQGPKIMADEPAATGTVHATNASQFGLSGNLWTRDVGLARKVARDLYTGGVFINGFTATDPRVPVGGVKNSGYGRELSHFGAHAFVNAQTVWIENA